MVRMKFDNYVRHIVEGFVYLGKELVKQSLRRSNRGANEIKVQ